MADAAVSGQPNRGADGRRSSACPHRDPGERAEILQRRCNTFFYFYE